MAELTGLSVHPCFNGAAHHRFGRIHLPVAPRCNIQCAYCDRKYDCPNESRPGVTSSLLSPAEALERTIRATRQEPRIRVAGVAGPGEPLANPETFEALRLIHEQVPSLLLCVSTNGLLLPESLEKLLRCGVQTLTITINAAEAAAAARIYAHVQAPDGRALHGEQGAAILLERQRRGLEQAVAAGFTVKINTVLIPGINDTEIPAIASLAAKAGASIMNIMPLIPCGMMQKYAPPTKEQLASARRRAGEYLPQFTLCKQCRADACGVPGLE